MFQTKAECEAYIVANHGEDYLKDQDSKADGHKGMGIGLSICKTIVSAHGGDIKARNHNEGSEFYFYLPKEKEE